MSTDAGSGEHPWKFILQPWMIDRPAMGCRGDPVDTTGLLPEHTEVQGVDAAGDTYQIATATESYKHYLESHAYIPLVDDTADESVVGWACNVIHEYGVDYGRWQPCGRRQRVPHQPTSHHERWTDDS